MRDKRGFTLIELLIVVVIIGILAAIAIPKFGSTRDRAYISTMKSDLRNLQSAQELYYASPGSGYVYADQISDLPDYSASAAVTITIPQYDGGEGYGAVAAHQAQPRSGNDEVRCFVYVGAVANRPSGAPNDLPAGVVGCTGETFTTGGGGTGGP